MENASRALIIAGGVLIGIIILSAFILMHNQISGYNKTKTTSKAEQEIIIFNKQFVKYADNDISGAELIDLMHKVQDYYKRGHTAGTIDDTQKIKLKIALTEKYKNTFLVKETNLFEGVPFKSNDFEIQKGDSNFEKKIDYYYGLENKYTISVMKKISSEYNNLSDTGKETIKNASGDTIKDFIKKATGVKDGNALLNEFTNRKSNKILHLI